jgi:hypothetical protein
MAVAKISQSVSNQLKRILADAARFDLLPVKVFKKKLLFH